MEVEHQCCSGWLVSEANTWSSRCEPCAAAFTVPVKLANMNDFDRKKYCFVTVLAPDTRVLGVPVAVWDDALLGGFQESMITHKGQTYRTQADINLSTQGDKDPACANVPILL
jgi:hypothetical protein